jgi:hypothetical protein
MKFIVYMLSKALPHAYVPPRIHLGEAAGHFARSVALSSPQGRGGPRNLTWLGGGPHRNRVWTVILSGSVFAKEF